MWSVREALIEYLVGWGMRSACMSKLSGKFENYSNKIKSLTWMMKIYVDFGLAAVWHGSAIHLY